MISQIVGHVDALFGNEEDLQKGLGITGQDVETKGKLDPDSFFKMIERGVPVALATDFNPGSSATVSLQMIMNLAAVMLKMTAAEIINCVTINSACALEIDGRVGSIETGKQADCVIWNANNIQQLPYLYGCNLVDKVVKNGRFVN